MLGNFWDSTIFSISLLNVDGLWILKAFFEAFTTHQNSTFSFLSFWNEAFGHRSFKKGGHQKGEVCKIQRAWKCFARYLGQLSMDLSFSCISPLKYGIASENPLTFDNRKALEMSSTWCVKWQYCSVIALDHLWGEALKMKKVRNCFSRYLGQISMDLIFQYSIGKIFPSPLK